MVYKVNSKIKIKTNTHTHTHTHTPIHKTSLLLNFRLFPLQIITFLFPPLCFSPSYSFPLFFLSFFLLPFSLPISTSSILSHPCFHPFFFPLPKFSPHSPRVGHSPNQVITCWSRKGQVLSLLCRYLHSSCK